MSGAVDPSAEILRARAAFAAGDTDGLVAHLSAAIRALTGLGRPRDAAMACVELGFAYAYGLGNLTASRAWFARAERLVADEPPCVEQGWVAVAAMGCDVDDPSELLEKAELALDRARTFGDINLEAKALADGGLARVRLGRIDEGMARLDEAMALVCGPADDRELATRSVCSFFTACYDTGDYGRVGAWDQAISAHGLMGPIPGGPVFLSGHCSSVRAALLCELGRWSEAERLYLDALDEFESVMHSPAWHPAIGLADLRTRQGRFTEAEQLLIGRAAWIEALLPMARLHLARDEFALAAATARRGLAAVGHDRIRTIELCALDVDAQLGLRDLPAARAAAARLDGLSDGLVVPALLARLESVRSRLARAEGDSAAAIDHLAKALAVLQSHDLAWLRVLLSIELADLYDAAGRVEQADVELRLALGVLERLDGTLPQRHRAIIDRLRAPAARPGTAVLRRSRSGWQAEHGDVRVPLRASKGLRFLAELISRPGAEFHVLDLVDRIEGVGDVDRRSLGDAGAVLDGAARAAYRRRVEDLRREIDEAIGRDDLDRAERLQDEVDAVVAQLAAAFGLGGRDRRAASAAERARLNVTRALRTATSGLSGVLPDAGAALDRHLHTGIYCRYAPVDGDIAWIVQSEVNGSRRS